MKNIYENLGKEELQKICADLRKQYEDYQALGLKLDISRGKPSPEQLALSMPMLDTMHSDVDYLSEDGLDTRNYGALTGIPEAKRLMGEGFDIPPGEHRVDHGIE